MALVIQKRDGSQVSFNPTKILNRIKKASKGLTVSPDDIFIKVITAVPTDDVIKTTELDKLIAEIAESYTTSHHDYSRLAANVSISSYQKETHESFYEAMKELYEDGVVNEKLINIIEKYGPEKIEAAINLERDYSFDYFAWRSLVEMYLLKNSSGVAKERPQHMYMRDRKSVV
jgi:ribonucleoside-diphosphate reductase alpha chain